MRESRFVNLTSYCIVEYMLQDLGSLDVINDDFILLQNDYLDSHQIFNPDGSFNNTRNIQDLTALPIDGGRYVYLDSEKIPDYIDYDDNITATTISGYNVTLDKIRFHFIAGFDFNDFRSIVLSVKNKENDSKINVFASILFNQDTSGTLLTFNPKPLYVTNSMYDRYIDVYVPSIKNINEEFNISPTPATTFSAAITPTSSSYSGFITNSPITVSIDECDSQENIDTPIGVTYEAYQISNHFETSVSQSNEFDGLGAYIDESSDGDYIEFFLTYNSAFPEDLISILNSRNPSNDYIIAHELTVYEQIGSSFVESSRLAFFQDNNFDEANLYRPVLKNANNAVSMSIDYIVRLVNRLNGDQVIREGSLIVNSPNKYGLQLLKLELQDKPQSQVVYNKIYKKNFEATELFIDPTQNSNGTSGSNVQTQVITKTEYVPLFFSNSKISISNKGAVVTETDNMETVIFPNGDLRFVLSPFDNYLKFQLYTYQSSKPVPLDLNINASLYRAVFETPSGKIKIENLNDATKENLSNGEIIFNIPEASSEEILQSTDNTFYITSVAKDGTETLIYNGEWRNANQQDEVDSAIAAIKTEADSKTQTTLTEINDSIKTKETNILQNNVTGSKSINVDIPGLVTKNIKKGVSAVNKFGMKYPTSIKTTRKDA